MPAAWGFLYLPHSLHQGKDREVSKGNRMETWNDRYEWATDIRKKVSKGSTQREMYTWNHWKIRYHIQERKIEDIY